MHSSSLELPVGWFHYSLRFCTVESTGHLTTPSTIETTRSINGYKLHKPTLTVRIPSTTAMFPTAVYLRVSGKLRVTQALPPTTINHILDV